MEFFYFVNTAFDSATRVISVFIKQLHFWKSKVTSYLAVAYLFDEFEHPHKKH